MQCVDEQLTVRLPADVAASIDELARANGLKRADVVRAALRDYLAVHGGRARTKPIDLARDLIGSVSLAPRSNASSRAELIDRIRRHAARR